MNTVNKPSAIDLKMADILSKYPDEKLLSDLKKIEEKSKELEVRLKEIANKARNHNVIYGA